MHTVTPQHLRLTRRFRRAAAPVRHGAGPLARRIVLTGGPGGGKSTAASFLAREYPERLWVLPEAATLLYQGGMPRGDNAHGVRVAQRSIFDLQRALEHAHAAQNPDRVLLCDRGTIDGAAYWPGGADAFFASMGSSLERELHVYDAVVFMRSAATLPGGYERDLAVRTERRDEALALDAEIFALYERHPRLIEIESTGTFLDKLVAVTRALDELL